MDVVPNLVPYSVAACATLLSYDLLCTLDQEITHVWRRPWNFGTLIFFMNRYLPFIDTSISLNLLTAVHTSEACLRNFKAVTWFILAGIIISEIILMLRTYAIWERKRSVLIALCILSLFIFIPCIIITYLELATLRYDPTLPGFTGCTLGHASEIIFIAYVLLMVWETTIVVLTMVKASQHLRHLRSSWILQLYRDGILFYFCILGVTAANVIVPVAAPPFFANWLATPQRVVHSVLCTRVLLFMRRAHQTKDTRDASNNTKLSNMSFTSRPGTETVPEFAAVDETGNAPRIELEEVR